MCILKLSQWDSDIFYGEITQKERKINKIKCTSEREKT